MEIIIENIQDKMEVLEETLELIREAALLSLEEEQFDTPSEISILLADNQYIREINKEHRKIDKATDVLSFPMADILEGELLDAEGDIDMDTQLLVLGDIIISLEKADEQAKSYGHSFQRELAFLVTHGVFHLLGYDHEEEHEGTRMFQKQEEVLHKLNLDRG